MRFPLIISIVCLSQCRHVISDSIPPMQAPAIFTMPPCNNFTLHEATIDQLQSAYASGRLSAEKVVQCYLDRIQQTNGWLNSVQEVNPDALNIAIQLDAERRAGKVRGPLHGVPCLVKDNIATADRMQTTAGSFALMGSVVPRDAMVTSNLRRAGAIILGKAALTEWAHMRSSSMSEGYSARGGQVRSAYNFTVNPGGSSSGSAAGVAANQAMFSLGTETDGSVIIPAERNALVGIKPTVGLTSRNGVVPETRHQDTVGVFGRSVRDAALALDGIYGVDVRDNFTAAQVGKTPDAGYAQSARGVEGLRGKRLGIPWESLWALHDPAQCRELLEILEALGKAGATIVNRTEIVDYKRLVNPTGWDWNWRGKLGLVNESEYTVVKVDFYNDVKAYLSELGDSSPIKSVEDIIAYNVDSTGTEGGIPGTVAGFAAGQERFHESAATKGIEDDTYRSALNFTQSTSRQGIDGALDHPDGAIDALLVPTGFQQAGMIAAQAGYPLVSVPAGVNSTRTGMPFGLMLMGTAWSEARLIELASAIEVVVKSEKGPRPLPEWRDYRRRVVPVLDE